MMRTLIIIGLFCFGVISALNAQVNERLVKLTVEETAGLSWERYYVQADIYLPHEEKYNIVADDINRAELVPCQTTVRIHHSNESVAVIQVVFPTTLKAYERKTIILRRADSLAVPVSDLIVSGKETELVIENRYYRADLRRSEDSPAKNHFSGQLRELLIKMDFNTLLMRTENRMHWAPNFRKSGEQDYYTISEWDQPQINRVYQGAYIITTERQDLAPHIPEILVAARYHFYSQLPYFEFYSEMETISDLWLDLLRNDEMTMDTLFTHVAYETYNQQIVDLAFSERYQQLKDHPIPAGAPWLCFYHQDRGYAFGSIRIVYDNRDEFGRLSPTYRPQTKINDGAAGGKYWDRKLIADKAVFVPAGSRYTEHNAYLVFALDEDNKFRQIQYWADRLRNPPAVSVIQYYIQ